MASLMVLSMLLLSVAAISCVSFIDGGSSKSIDADSDSTLEKVLPSGQHLNPEKISDNCTACAFEELINKPLLWERFIILGVCDGRCLFHICHFFLVINNIIFSMSLN